MTYVLLWGLLGLVGFSIGLKKHLHVGDAILGGVLLGPISFLMVFLTDEGKRCPNCAESVKQDAKICKHCGYDFTHQNLIP